MTLSGKSADGHILLLRVVSQQAPMKTLQKFNLNTNQSDTTGYAPNPNFDWKKSFVKCVEMEQDWTPGVADWQVIIHTDGGITTSQHLDVPEETQLSLDRSKTP